MARLFLGTSGWVYPHWRTVFYPPGLPADEQLAFYAGQFGTVEINYSYYHLPERAVFEHWRQRAPSDFTFAVKASRYLTHMKKLNEPADPLRRLMESAGGLEEKLGPVLFQFPKWWRLNLDRLAGFLDALQAYPGHRWAFEFRHQTWLDPRVFALLEGAGAALCLPVGWEIPLQVRLTAGWTYVRFHGGQHGISFSDAELQPWADRLRAWLADGVDCYVYFNNDPPAPELGNLPGATTNGRHLREMIGDWGAR